MSALLMDEKLMKLYDENNVVHDGSQRSQSSFWVSIKPIVEGLK
jgi:hypothetical protein